MIIHCMTEKRWNKIKNQKTWGKSDVRKNGFIHCSTVEYFWRVAPNFKDVIEPLVLVCIDESKLKSEVIYENPDECGRLYPHIYGVVNNDAVIQVIPFLRDENGNYVKNPEFADIKEK